MPPLAVDTSLAAQSTTRFLAAQRKNLADSVARLSSGVRLRSAKDGPAALAVAQGFEFELRSLSQAERNLSDGASLIQTADGALEQVSDILGRMRELAVGAASGTLDDSARGAIQEEFSQLSQELTRISDATEFAGVNPLGADAGSFVLQVGAGSTTADQLLLSFSGSDAAALGVDDTGAGVATASSAQAAIATIDAAVASVSTRRASLGASLARLSMTAENLGTARENLAAAASRVRDTDFAAESSELLRARIQSKFTVALQAQARRIPSSALTLIGG